MRFVPFFLLFLFQGVIGQTSFLTRTIEWQDPKPQLQPGNIKDITSFSNSYCRDIKGLFPYYYENIPVDENRVPFSLSFVRTETQTISNEILPQYFKKKLTNEFSLEFYTSRENGKKILQYTIFPFRINPVTGKPERLISFALRIDQQEITPELHKKKLKSGTIKNSLLATGDWYKIRTEEEGIHRISYNDLIKIGIANPENAKIFGYGGKRLPEDSRKGNQNELIEVPVFIEKGGDGVFNSGDYLLFYALGTVEWNYNENEDYFHHEKNPYSDYGYYFITSGDSPAVSPQNMELAEAPADYISRRYDALAYHELDEVNLIKSGKEWYGEIFDVTTERSFSFHIPSLDRDSPVKMKTNLLGRSKSDSHYVISVNNNTIDTARINDTNLGDYTAVYAYTSSEIYSFSSLSDNLEVELQYIKPDPTAQGWLDYLSVNARAELKLQGDQLIFRDSECLNSSVTEYIVSEATASALVWEVSDYPYVKNVPGDLNGNTFSFKVEGGNLHEFIAFDPAADFPGVTFEGEGLGKVENQNLSGSGYPDLVIVSHQDFIPYAEELAQYRSDHNELEVLLTTPEKIYNEFSSGRPDVTAIRNFMQYLYLGAGENKDLQPQYLLLYGDGSYIFKSNNPNDGNFVPAYQSDNSLSPISSFVTDDFYGLLDEGENISSGLLDIGIGRLPVSNEEEAEIMLNKIINYESPERQGEWRNTIVFIGDDEDNNIHFNQADELARYVEGNYPAFNVNKIYLDAYQQVSTPVGQRYPEVNKAINRQVNKGALIVNYTGHGGTKGLAHERILEMNDIQSWNNQGKLPLFMTATCEFSRFDEPELVSAGEKVILSPEGGGIALLTTTRLVYAGPNHVLNEKFYEIVFEKNEEGKNYCLGDIMKYSKNNAGVGINKRNFTLLGDPAMRLTYPFHNIVADSINQAMIQEESDTIRALSEVRITGHVQNAGGDLLDSFNGIIYPTVYDKPSEQTTLANDGGSKKSFKVRNNILYKGKATVENGYFEFSFIVPKDINYAYGPGKISFYSSDSLKDASGAYLDFIVGGSEPDPEPDFEGPEISVYMNNNFFEEGGLTNEEPVLFVEVYDEQGINTTGNGIGHDITATLNGDTQNSIVLNEFYQADLNSYQSGTIIYPLSNLEEGNYFVEVKVWDIFNNSATGSTEFVVVKSDEMLLQNLKNYPNPFKESTYFTFEHNKSDQDLDITIDIFDMSGALVRTIKAKEYGAGFRSQPVYWNGKNESGNQSRQGVYLYRIRVTSSDGREGVETGRLIILR